jgi:hypothetical protein
MQLRMVQWSVGCMVGVLNPLPAPPETLLAILGYHQASSSKINQLLGQKSENKILLKQRLVVICYSFFFIFPVFFCVHGIDMYRPIKLFGL